MLLNCLRAEYFDCRDCDKRAVPEDPDSGLGRDYIGAKSRRGLETGAELRRRGRETFAEQRVSDGQPGGHAYGRQI